MNAPLIAVISKEWKQRMQIISALVAGIGCWFLFDGLFTYPKSNVKAAVYEELEKQHGKDTPELGKAWEASAKERGWAADKPKSTYPPDAIQTQLILGFLALIGAGFCLFHYFRSLPLTTRLEGERIFLPDGREIELSKIRGLSKRRWDSKGIADLAYEASPGKMKKFILDDYKYIGAAQILEEVEKSLAPPADPQGGG